MNTTNASQHQKSMDRVYRFQRYFYDVTRPLFLPGRNRLLDTMAPGSGDRVLEVGCGTARNLLYLARKFQDATYYGVDISEEMLKTAQKNVTHSRVKDNIVLRCEAAENIDLQRTFSIDGKFDCVFFSYSLSMIPLWQDALEIAKSVLKPSGKLFIVDFQDMQRLPAPAGVCLKKWLSLFHVHPHESMLDEICRQFPNTQVVPLWGGYAFMAYTVSLPC